MNDEQALEDIFEEPLDLEDIHLDTRDVEPDEEPPSMEALASEMPMAVKASDSVTSP